MKLSPDQQQAWDEMWEFITGSGHEHALSGPAGTGKTFLISRFVGELKANGYSVHLCATTNKAAHVAGEMGDHEDG